MTTISISREAYDRYCAQEIEYENRITSLENRLALAMQQLADLGCDTQWYLDQAQIVIDRVIDKADNITETKEYMDA